MTTSRTGRALPPRVAGYAVAAALLAAVAGPPPAHAESVTAVSYGGSYARACQKAYHEPFTAETGIEVRLADFGGDLAQIRAQVETGNVHWDVVDLNFPELVRGCDEGLLEPIAVDDLPPAPDGTPARDDYFEGVPLEGCSGGGILYSTVYAYNRESFPGEKPTTMADFFDLEKFPGRRGMRREAAANLEFALVADGVPADRVYEVLDTPEGVDRAFRKLDTIKDRIVWWEAGAQPPQMLADREVSMSTAWNGRIFNAQVLEDQPFTIVWDGQVLDGSSLAIVAGTPNLEAARRFLLFAARVESMAAVSRYIAYGPARHSGASLVSTHAETGIDMRPHMPTSPRNMVNAVFKDWEWWSDNADEINERFGAWLAR